MDLDLTKMDSTNQVSNSVYDTLKYNIQNLNIKPGDRISEQEISKLLNVSRTPVREAFINLSREGLVNVLPQRGTIVSKIDFEQVEEARFIRESLELSIVEIVSEVIDEYTLSELEKNVNRQKEALVEKNYSQMMIHDQKFHKLIFEVANKNRTWQIIEQISTHYRMTRLLSLAGNISWELAIKQHESFVEALRKDDKQSVVAIMREHLRNISIDQETLREKYPDYFK